MRRLGVIIATAGLMGGLATPAQAAQGGPDAFGYTFIDSAEPGGPTFAYIDITGTGAIVLPFSDDTSGNVATPFPVTIYGQTVNSLGVTSNGVVSVQANPSAAFSNSCVPSATFPQETLFVHWDDLVSTVRAETLGVAPDRQFIIQWDGGYFSGGGSMNFQLVIDESDPGNWQYRYQTLDQTASSALIGIQAAGGAAASSFLQYSCNQADSVASGRAIDWNLGGQPPGPQSFKYVALGDSFSAGEGIEPFFEPHNKCHRSESAFATLVERPGLTGVSAYEQSRAGLLEIDVQWGFQACSGATTEDVLTTGQWADPLPQLAVDRAADTGNAHDLPVDGDTDLVTITIGGNDVHFSDVLTFCALSKDCTTERYQGVSLAQYNRNQRDLLSPRLDAVYARIHGQAPDARILVLGYPQLFPQSHAEQTCFRLGQKNFRSYSIGFTEVEQNYLRQATSELNQLIAARVEQNGFAEFVRVEGLFAGHEVCGSLGEWINGPSAAALESGRRREYVSNDQSFHPNACGQAGMAALINLRVNGHLDEVCA